MGGASVCFSPVQRFQNSQIDLFHKKNARKYSNSLSRHNTLLARLQEAKTAAFKTTTISKEKPSGKRHHVIHVLLKQQNECISRGGD